MHGHLTTFEAAVHGFGSQRDLASLRRELRRKYTFDGWHGKAPKLVSKTGPYYDPRVGRYSTFDRWKEEGMGDGAVKVLGGEKLVAWSLDLRNMTYMVDVGVWCGVVTGTASASRGVTPAWCGRASACFNFNFKTRAHRHRRVRG